MARWLDPAIPSRELLKPLPAGSLVRDAGRLSQPAATQLPWKPGGMRCGILIRACGSPSKSARVEDDQLGRLVVQSMTRPISQPSSSAASACAGTKTNSPGCRPGPKSWTCRVPASRSCLNRPRAEEGAGQRHRIGIAIGQAEAPLVGPREFLRRRDRSSGARRVRVSGSIVQRSSPLRFESGPALLSENILSCTTTSRITRPSAAS